MSFSNADKFDADVLLDVNLLGLSVASSIRKNIVKYRYSISDDNRIIFEDGSEYFHYDDRMKVDNSRRRIG
jgi:hypothetical protein